MSRTNPTYDEKYAYAKTKVYVFQDVQGEVERRVPKLRFSEFTGDWEQCKLGEYTEIVKRVNNDSTAPVRMISAGNGFILQSEKYSRDNAGQSLKKYIELHRGELAYNHGYSKAKKYGSCFMLEESDTARVPFVYHCFSITKGNPKFFAIILNRTELNSELVKYISSTARMDGLLNISYDDYMSIEVRVPQSGDEQAKIADFLSRLDNTIALHQRKLDAMKEYKSGLLQKMFPKAGETVPEIRFPGFAGDWEQRKLESLCDVFTDGDWIESKDQSEAGVRLVQTGNVGTTQYLDKENHKKWISEETFERLKCKEIYEGDILISRLPEPAGRACIMPNLGTKMITAVDCTIVRTSNECDSRYLVQYLATPSYFKDVNAFLGGGTRQRISRGNLSEINIPFPSNLDEQAMIGKFFEELDNTIALHQRKLDAMKEYKSGLLQKMFC